MFTQCFSTQLKFPKPEYTSAQKQSAQSFLKYHGIVKQFAQTVLFCREPDEILTVAEGKILNNQRKKFIDYAKKSYKYKLADELTNRKVFKQRTIELREREKLELLAFREEQQKLPKRQRPQNKTPVDPQPRKRTKIAEKPKVQAKSTKKTTKKDKKPQKEGQQQQQIVRQEVVEGNSEQNNPVDALNYESDEDLANRDVSEYQQDVE